MEIIINTLPPKFKTWLALYESLNKEQLAEIERQAETDADKSKVDIVDNRAQYDTRDALYRITLGHIKKRAFEELYSDLPTHEQRHNARKRAYMAMNFNPTAGQNIVDFINSIPCTNAKV